MKFSSDRVLAFFMAMMATSSSLCFGQTAPPGTEQLGPDNTGYCTNQENGRHDYAFTLQGETITIAECDRLCRSNNDLDGLRGFSTYEGDQMCYCWYDDGTAPGMGLPPDECPPGSPFHQCRRWPDGFGPIDALMGTFGFNCFRYLEFPVAQANGDPHFRTWKNEHFEFHGQCDIVMTKVKNFASKDMDLDIHLRTSMVQYWSYIKAASIRIGNDILEVQGSSAAKEDGEDKRHHWINFEYRGDITDLGGFPVTINPRNDKYIIDLDSAYPGQKIEIKNFNEFVGVKIIGATEESFGNAVGITGDFKTGNTYARDGITLLNDFNELGMEWQVLPSDGKLFHEMARPQFPELCYLPEDPRGERARRLDESNITEEQAEAACAGLDDEFDRKGCVYDILATQDLNMVGAY
ncbi:unnamed protein product [Cylindrotheca closterium]|uniref:VWFD domain-containing protein n=1 Tax=Cylindrotheca closterium TaxID=2856 RepID=A0AAD2PUX7_9STRA|nr:unnamed protein product [Cylindrotheca closterium]CAJ1953193.1 unnamed protein product [Cylindrotheca closterium]